MAHSRTRTKDANNALSSALSTFVRCLHTLTNVSFWKLVHPVKIWGVIYGNSRLHDFIWENAIIHSYLNFWLWKPRLCPILISNRKACYKTPEYLSSRDCDTEFSSQILKLGHLRAKEVKSQALDSGRPHMTSALPCTPTVEGHLCDKLEECRWCPKGKRVQYSLIPFLFKDIFSP